MKKVSIQNSILKLLDDDFVSKEILKNRIDPRLNIEVYEAAVSELKSLGYIDFIQSKDGVDLKRTFDGKNAYQNKLIAEPTRISKIKVHFNEMNNIYTLLISLLALLISIWALLRE